MGKVLVQKTHSDFHILSWVVGFLRLWKLKVLKTCIRSVLLFQSLLCKLLFSFLSCCLPTHFYFSFPPSHRRSPELSGHQCRDFPNPLLLADWSCNEMYPNIRFSLSCPHLLPLCADISRYPSSVPPPSQPPPPLCSPGPRVARSILFHRTSNRPDALREAGPRDHNICTGRHGGCAGRRWWWWRRGERLWPQRGEGRTRHATSRCHQDPNSRLWERRRDRAMYQRAHPNIPAWGARRQTPLLLTSPHLAARPPPLLPPFDSTIR